MDDRTELLRLLEAWNIGTVSSLVDIAHPGKGSRTWEVTTTLGGRYVAKLIFSTRESAEPGLRVAVAVDDKGIPTGRPVVTSEGNLSVEVDTGSDRWTLALLRHVAGSPLDLDIEAAPQLVGGLLGRVHAALQVSTSQAWVPGDLLALCARDSSHTPVASALDRINDLERDKPLTRSVIYGDPAPEILLVDERSQSLGLIDWGTPSRGPLLYDLACWLQFLASDGRGSDTDRSAFIGAYLDHVSLDTRELDAIEIFLALHQALASGPGLPARW